MNAPMPAKMAPTYAYNKFGIVSFTVGTKVATTINVAVQLQDVRGRNVAERVGARVYLSDASTGAGITATATTTALAVGTNGSLLAILVTGKMMEVLTDASGRFDINVIQSSTASYYMVVILPDGSIAVSTVITF